MRPNKSNDCIAGNCGRKYSRQSRQYEYMDNVDSESSSFVHLASKDIIDTTKTVTGYNTYMSYSTKEWIAELIIWLLWLIVAIIVAHYRNQLVNAWEIIIIILFPKAYIIYALMDKFVF